MNPVIRNMSLFEFEVFVTTSGARSIRAAARVLRLEPSHVSKIIRRIEEKIDRKLIDRSPSGIVLNRDGLFFENIAKKILKETAALQYDFSDDMLTDQVKESLTIGAMSFVNKSLVAPLIQAIENIDDKFSLRLLDIHPDKLVSSGVKGAFPIAIHTSKKDWPATWSVHQIGQVHWKLYSRRGHPLGSYATEAEVQKYPYVIPTYWDGNTYAIGNDFCPLPLSKRRQGHESSSADTASQIVRYSDQLAFLPDMIVKAYPNASDLTEINVSSWKKVTQQLYLAVKTEEIKKSFEKKLVKLLRTSLSV